MSSLFRALKIEQYLLYLNLSPVPERNQKRVHELDMLIRKIYEDNVIGRLPDRLFQKAAAVKRLDAVLRDQLVVQLGQIGRAHV